jgi:hypothetical protein
VSSCRPIIASSLNHTDERSPGQALGKHFQCVPPERGRLADAENSDQLPGW